MRSISAVTAQTENGSSVTEQPLLQYDIGYENDDGSFNVILARGALLPAVGFFSLEVGQRAESVNHVKRIISASDDGEDRGKRRPLGIVTLRLEGDDEGNKLSVDVGRRIVLRADTTDLLSMEVVTDERTSSPFEIHIFDKPPDADHLQVIAVRTLTRKENLLPYARGVKSDAVVSTRQFVMREAATAKWIEGLRGDQANRRAAYVRMLYLDLALDALESVGKGRYRSLGAHVAAAISGARI
jgi:hypothetical protein